MLGIFKLGRVARLNQIIGFLKSSEDVKAILRLFKMILFLTIYIHLFACNWWFIIKHDKNWVSPRDTNYVNMYQLYEQTFLTRYLITVQISVTSIMGGDILPLNQVQILTASFGIFIGAII